MLPFAAAAAAWLEFFLPRGSEVTTMHTAAAAAIFGIAIVTKAVLSLAG